MIRERTLVLTGGPSAGKTTLAEAIHREFPSRVVVVPESASILFRGGFPRASNVREQLFQQRAIYFLQRELENLLLPTDPSHLQVCDRGSLDGLAYWPEGVTEQFFSSLETNREKELARYGWALHLDTAAAQSYDQSNPLRVENHARASEINEKIKRAWDGHPRRFIIHNSQLFHKKVRLALTIVESILAGESYEDIVSKNQDVLK